MNRLRRAVLRVFDDFTHVIHAGVAGGVDFNHVDVVTAGDGQTRIALPAGRRRGGVEFVAVQGLGQDSGRTGLSGAPSAAEQVGVGDAAGLNGPLQRLGDVLLADELIEIG